MTLYEIREQIDMLINASTDSETGELLIDPAELEALEIAREDKIEQLALYVKNLNAEAAAIKTEVDNLTVRMRSAKNKADRIRDAIAQELGGEKFSSARVSISYRNSTAVELDDCGFITWAMSNGKSEYLRQKPPEPDKKAITDALKAGEEIPGAELVTRTSITIK